MATTFKGDQEKEDIGSGKNNSHLQFHTPSHVSPKILKYLLSAHHWPTTFNYCACLLVGVTLKYSSPLSLASLVVHT